MAKSSLHAETAVTSKCGSYDVLARGVITMGWRQQGCVLAVLIAASCESAFALRLPHQLSASHCALQASHARLASVPRLQLDDDDDFAAEVEVGGATSE